MTGRAVVLALAAGLLAAAPAAAEPSAARQGELLALVRQDCGSCHGLTLKGGLGPPLLPQALEGRNEAAVAEVILGGVPGTPMPPWRTLLTPPEALWIAQQLIKGLP